MKKKPKFFLHKDYYAGIGSGVSDWAVYESCGFPRCHHRDHAPLAVFGKRGHALSFKKMMENS